MLQLKHYLRPGKHLVWKTAGKSSQSINADNCLPSYLLFFYDVHPTCDSPSKGTATLANLYSVSLLKVTFTNNRRDGFVKLGWQQSVLNDKGPGLLAFVTLIPFPPRPSATCLSFSAFLCVVG
jgi:hypothetical protein